MPEFFKITQDRVNDDGGHTLVGTVFLCGKLGTKNIARNPKDWDEPVPDEKEFTQSFMLYDDDGELYFRGKATAGVEFEPLDWATWYAGATEIRYRNPTTGKYETL